MATILEEKVKLSNREYNLRKSVYATTFSPICVSDNMSGKMLGIPSTSTACVCNPICIERMKNGLSICAHCFAEATVNHYPGLRENTISNYHLLTEQVLPLDMLPRFDVNKSDIVRIESFGDVANITQAINYANMCKVNPEIRFAWWSKNMKIIEKAFEITGKPDNVVMIESSPLLNTPVKPSSWIVDKVFTVFDKQTIAEKNIRINCGARCCKTCQRCYYKNTDAVINEQLK